MPSRGFRNLLYGFLPRPKALREAATRHQRIERVIALVHKENPTYSYYIEERMKSLNLPFEVIGPSPRLRSLRRDNAFVIICRYVSLRQLFWMLFNRGRLNGVAYFVDDDVPAMIVERGGDAAYKAYLFFFAVAPLPILNRILTHVWVSTGALRDRIASADLLGPCPGSESLSRRPDGDVSRRSHVTIAYHASGLHEAEHRFLVPVLVALMRRYPSIRFEVIACRRSASLWRDAEIDGDRLTVLPTMDWPAYRRHSETCGVDILLIPLLHGVMNSARADTKRIDAARMGAAAVFSRGTIYEQSAAPGEVFIDNDPAVWAATIARLIEDEAARRAVAAAVASAAAAMAGASRAFPGLEHVASKPVPAE